MKSAIERTCWAISEGYIPAYGTGTEPQFTSHETACMLNTSDQDAQVEIMIYSDCHLVKPHDSLLPTPYSPSFLWSTHLKTAVC